MKNKIYVIGLIAGVCVVVAIVFLISRLSVPEPKINYTYADLEVSPEIASSYKTYLRYPQGGTNNPTVALPQDLLWAASKWTNLTMHAEAIDIAWSSYAEGRRYIHDLDQYSGIIDCMDYSGNPLEVPMPSFSVWRGSCRLYSLYAMLKSQQGNPQAGISELKQLHSVVRKSLPYSTLLMSKAVNLVIGKQNIGTAYNIIKHTECTPCQLRELKKAFPPLTSDQVSLWRPILMEYVAAQYFTDNALSLHEDSDDGLFSRPSYRSAVVLRFIYDRPRTLAFFKDYFEPQLQHVEAGNVSSDVFLKAEHRLDDYLNSNLRFVPYNVFGKKLISILTPSISKMNNVSLETKAWSDILFLEICKQLDETTVLRDVYNNDYLFDQQLRCFFSAGEDGEPGTEDDVYINDINASR